MAVRSFTNQVVRSGQRRTPERCSWKLGFCTSARPRPSGRPKAVSINPTCPARGLDAVPLSSTPACRFTRCPAPACSSSCEHGAHAPTAAPSAGPCGRDPAAGVGAVCCPSGELGALLLPVALDPSSACRPCALTKLAGLCCSAYGMPFVGTSLNRHHGSGTRRLSTPTDTHFWLACSATAAGATATRPCAACHHSWSSSCGASKRQATAPAMAPPVAARAGTWLRPSTRGSQLAGQGQESHWQPMGATPGSRALQAATPPQQAAWARSTRGSRSNCSRRLRCHGPRCRPGTLPPNQPTLTRGAPKKMHTISRRGRRRWRGLGCQTSQAGCLPLPGPISWPWTSGQH